jgi:hypothetical protein
MNVEGRKTPAPNDSTPGRWNRTRSFLAVVADSECTYFAVELDEPSRRAYENVLAVILIYYHGFSCCLGLGKSSNKIILQVFDHLLIRNVSTDEMMEVAQVRLIACVRRWFQVHDGFSFYPNGTERDQPTGV